MKNEFGVNEDYEAMMADIGGSPMKIEELRLTEEEMQTILDTTVFSRHGVYNIAYRIREAQIAKIIKILKQEGVKCQTLGI